MPSSNTIEILLAANDQASETIDRVTGNLSGGFEAASQHLTTAGASLTTAATPFLGALTSSVMQASAFDAAMTNVAAVMGLTTDEASALSAQILATGATARAGPQAVAEAYYDIVGGVADVTAHQAILNAAIATSEAGNAELAGTTSALISVMNSYGFSADQAAHVSDLLVATVGKGVGTMDDFAGAFPQVTGLASSMGISLDEVASSMALLTTKGFSAGQSATQLQAIMSALLNPNAQLTAAIQELGYATGTDLVNNVGDLTDVLGLLSTTDTFSEQGWAPMLGSVEALNGALVLSTDQAAEFEAGFAASVDGATAKAREIQLNSFAAQFDLVKAAVSALFIEVGMALLPTLTDMVGLFGDVVGVVSGVVQSHSNLVVIFAEVVGAATAIGGALTAAGASIGILVSVATVAISPLALVVAAIAAVGYALVTNFGGIRDAVETVLGAIGAAVEGVVNRNMARALPRIEQLSRGASTAVNALSDIFATVLVPALTTAGTYIAGHIVPVLGDALFDAFDMAFVAAQMLGVAWEQTLYPALVTVGDFFTDTILPVLGDVVSFLADNMPPPIYLIAGLATLLAAPFVGLIAAGSALYEAWTGNFLGIAEFLTTNLPVAIATTATFVTDTLLPAVVNFAAFVQTDVIPAVTTLAEWLVAHIPDAVGVVVDVWNGALGPALSAGASFITGTVIPAVSAVAGWLSDNIPVAIGLAADGWNNVLSPALSAVAAFTTETLIPAVNDIIGFLGVALPIAAGLVAAGFNEVLIPAAQAVGDFLTNTLLPAISDAGAFLGVALPIAAGLVAAGFNEHIMPAVRDVGDFIDTTLVPALSQAGAFLGVTLPIAAGIISNAFNNVLAPAARTAADLFTANLIPALQLAANVTGFVLGAALSIAASMFNTVLKPAASGLYDLFTDSIIPVVELLADQFETGLKFNIDLAKTSFDTISVAAGLMATGFSTYVAPVIDVVTIALHDGLKGALDLASAGFDLLAGAADGIIGSLGSVGDAIDEISDAWETLSSVIPDSWIPGSPTPMEMGLWGIGEAMDSLASGSMPSLTSGLGSLPGMTPTADGSTAGGGSTYNITVMVDGALLGTPAQAQANGDIFGQALRQALLSGG